MNVAWGTKRSCISCAARFYDLNKAVAQCPKCGHSFDPAAVVRMRRKAARKDSMSEEAAPFVPTVLAGQKAGSVKAKDSKKKRASEDDDIPDISELEEVDDLENIHEISTIADHDTTSGGDDADEEAIIEELDTGDKTLVGSVEYEEAEALVEEIEEEEQASKTKTKAKKAKK